MSIIVIILSLCFLPILPIMYFVMRSEAKSNNNIILGVTLPHEVSQCRKVEELCAAYRRNLLLTTLLLLLLAVVPYLFNYISLFLTAFLVWLILVIFVPFIPYIIFHRRLKQLKQQNLWFCQNTGSQTDADSLSDDQLFEEELRAAKAVSGEASFSDNITDPILSDDSYSQTTGGSESSAETAADNIYVSGQEASFSEPKPGSSSKFFIVPLTIACLPILVTLSGLSASNDSQWLNLLYGSNVLVIIIFALFYRVDGKQNAESAKISQSSWRCCCLVFAWLAAAYNLSFWLLHDSAWAILIITIIFILLLFIIVMGAVFLTHRQQHQAAESGQYASVQDEDRYWIIGMFYYNPDDSDFLVNKRIGMGTTVNLATLGGKIFMGFAAICIAAIPLFGVWMMKEEFTPVSLSLSENRITASHISEKYCIDTDDIVSFELLSELPPASKNIGTNMDNLLKGSFSVDGYGSCNLCLNPSNPPFLLLKTSEETYILGSSESAAASTAYQYLVQEK